MMSFDGRGRRAGGSVPNNEDGVRADLDAAVESRGLDWHDLVPESVVPKIVTVGKRAPGAWMLSMLECQRVMNRVRGTD